MPNKSVAAACQIINRVGHALVSKRRQDVLFPDPNQLADVKQQLYAISNFPNVFGATDRTHKLHPPVVMMLGDSSENVYIPLMSKLPVMPKRR